MRAAKDYAAARYIFCVTGYLRRTKIKQNGDTLDEKIDESNLDSIYSLEDRGEASMLREKTTTVSRNMTKSSFALSPISRA